MTHVELYTIAARPTNRNISNPGHLQELKDAVVLALDEASTFKNGGYWWTQVECRLTLNATTATRAYAFPTQSALGTAMTLASWDVRTFRTDSKAILWKDRTELAHTAPDWADSDESGEPDYVTLAEGQFVFHPTPSIAFAAAHPTVYFDGWRMLRTPADTPTGDQLAWIAAVDMPRDRVLKIVPGVLKWLYQMSRSDEWVKEEDRFFRNLTELQGQSNPYRGTPTGQSRPAAQFSRASRASNSTREHVPL